MQEGRRQEAEGKKVCTVSFLTFFNLQNFPAQSDQLGAGVAGDRIWHQHHYPWTLVRLLPNAQHYTVARFYNRVEAENHKRFLAKWMPAAEFEVVFDEATVTAET